MKKTRREKDYLGNFKMQQRKIFYRRKGKQIAIDGTMNKKKINILTLPKDPIKLILGLQKGSFFTEENFQKIIKKVQGLGIRKKESEK